MIKSTTEAERLMTEIIAGALLSNAYGPHGHRGGKHGRPGEYIMLLSEEKRAILRTLQSEDIAKVRIDPGDI